MRILIHDFAGYSFPAQLSRELATLGHEVTYAYSTGLPGPKGCLTRSLGDSERLRFSPIALSRHFKKYSSVRRLVTHRQYARDLSCLIMQEQPDVVLSGNTPIDIQAELLLYCKRRKIGFVHWVQDVYCQAVEFFVRKKLPILARPVSFPFRFLERMVASHSDATLVISPDFRDLLITWGVPRDRIIVRENWAPLDEIKLPPRRNPWNQALNLGNLPVLLYAGTLGFKHRPDLIYELASRLRNECKVVVVSEGYGRDYLEGLPRLDNLILLGFQPYEQFPEVLASADVLVATLETAAGQFAVPSKVLSYLSACRPILLAGPKENLSASIVERSGSGFVVDPDDTLSWIAAARRLVSDPALRASLASSARRYAESTFNIRKIGLEFEQIFYSANHRGPARRPLVSAASA